MDPRTKTIPKLRSHPPLKLLSTTLPPASKIILKTTKNPRSVIARRVDGTQRTARSEEAEPLRVMRFLHNPSLAALCPGGAVGMHGAMRYNSDHVKSPRVLRGNHPFFPETPPLPRPPAPFRRVCVSPHKGGVPCDLPALIFPRVLSVWLNATVSLRSHEPLLSLCCAPLGLGAPSVVRPCGVGVRNQG